MKFTVITPANLEMSRLIMSVVAVAMSSEQQQTSDSGSDSGSNSDSLVSNIFFLKMKLSFFCSIFVAVYPLPSLFSVLLHEKNHQVK